MQYVYQDVSIRASGRLSVAARLTLTTMQFEILGDGKWTFGPAIRYGNCQSQAFHRLGYVVDTRRGILQAEHTRRVQLRLGGATLDVVVREGHFAATGSLAPLGVVLQEHQRCVVRHRARGVRSPS